MATHSIIKFYCEFTKEPILTVYQQCDGYIEGVGFELAKWLKDKKIINGISSQTLDEGYANGMGCLAAQFVADHKTKIGSLYIVSHDNEQEYNYRVKLIDDKLIIEVDNFLGTPNDLIEYIKNNVDNDLI